MPFWNVTIDDISPVFDYQGDWVDTNTDDSDFVDYLNSTFHATQDQGASVTFKFNGSAVYIFGAKRDNHDQYTTTLDGHSTIGNGFAPQPFVFKAPLFSQATNLDNTEHTVTLTDSSTDPKDRPFVDIDFVTITVGDDSEGTPVDLATDDSSSQAVYSQGWTQPTANQTFYSNNSYHRTSQPGASVTIPFIGSAVALYGATNLGYGPFSVSIDGASPSSFTASAPTFRPGTLLYYASGLDSAHHTITLTNIGNGSTSIDFDHLVATCFNCETSAAAAHVKRKNTAIIASLVVVIVVIILLLGGFWFWYVRRRRRQAFAADQEKRLQINVASYGPSPEPPAPEPYLGTPRTMAALPIPKYASQAPTYTANPDEVRSAISISAYSAASYTRSGAHDDAVTTVTHPSPTYTSRTSISRLVAAAGISGPYRSPGGTEYDSSPIEDAGPAPGMNGLPPPPQYGQVFRSAPPVPPVPPVPQAATATAAGTSSGQRPIIPPIITDLKTRPLPAQPREPRSEYI